MTGTSTTTTELSSRFVAFVLRQLDVGRLHALREANEIATTATALSGGIISAEAALLHRGVVVTDHFDELVERFVRQRAIETPLTMPRDAKRVAESTFQAVAYVLREYGMRRLNDPWLTNRLAGFSDAQIRELVVVLGRMQPKYPATTAELVAAIAMLKGQAS
jgi:hypothetical protein